MLQFTRFIFIDNFDNINTLLVFLKMMMCIAHSNFEKLKLIVIKYVKIIMLDVFIKKLDMFIKILDVFIVYQF